MNGIAAAWSSLFRKRLRGFRVVDMGALALLVTLVLGVYAFKAAAGQEGGRMRDVDQSIADETRAIRLVRAEVARLEQPERLERLSVAYLGLKAEDPHREAPADALPELIRKPQPQAAPGPIVPAPAPPRRSAMSPVDDARAPRSGLADAAHRLTDAVWGLEKTFRQVREADRPVDDGKLRIFLVLCLFSLAFGFMGVEAARKALSHEAVGADAPLSAFARAELTDRNGSLLATDLPHFGLYLDSREVWDAGETRSGLIRVLPRISAPRLDKALRSGRREYLAAALTPQERDAVHDLGLPGISFEEESKRVYPVGREGSHLIGYTDTAGAGLAGAERALDPQIRQAASGGGSVAMAMDLRIQGALDDELRKGMAEFSAVGAVGLVTDVQTGEVLALASMPDFDPTAYGSAGAEALRNKAGSDVYEMGSTFKMFTLATALDSGKATLDTKFDVSSPLVIGNSKPIHDFHPEHGAIDLTQIFDLSSNIGTGKLALTLGPGLLTRYYKSFGLMKAAPIELAESARPLLPRTWADESLARAAFGQGISVTPLMVAAGAGALMNGGVYTPLTIVRREPGTVVPTRRVISADTSRKMLDLMRSNVVAPHGSGGHADAYGLRVGGKTGSAQKPGKGGYEKNKVVTSFVAVFPTDGPVTARRYLVMVLMDDPQATAKTYGFHTAGWNSAVVAGRIVDRIAPFVGVARIPPPPKPKVAKVVAPAAKIDPDGDE